jgi:uncharacterized Zn finger protein
MKTYHMLAEREHCPRCEEQTRHEVVALEHGLLVRCAHCFDVRTPQEWEEKYSAQRDALYG